MQYGAFCAMICIIDGLEEKFFRTECFFRLADEFQLFQLLPVLGAGRNQVNPRRRQARMPEDVRQFDHVPRLPVKHLRKQVPEVVGEDFAGLDPGFFTERLHLRPNLFPVHRLPASGEKNLAGGGFLFPRVL